MFKEGDLVRCKKNPAASQSIGTGGGGFEEGLEFRVTTVTEVGGLMKSCYFGGLHGNGVYEDFLELVEEKKIEIAPMLKVDIGKHTILGQDKIKSQLKVAIEADMPVLLVGETGTGKTTVVKDIADELGHEFIRFNLTGETTVDEFVGKYTLKGGETFWQDGILLHAMKKGVWLIVDEVNVALPEILFVLHSLLDDDRSILVSNHEGEIITPHEDFRFFGTMNPVDEYAGTKDLNKAFKSRFGMILEVNYPNGPTESAIVVAKGGVDGETANKIVDTATAIRKAKQENEVFYTCSTRDLIQWAQLTKPLGIGDAFEVAVAAKANGDGKLIREIFSKVEKTYTAASKQGYVLNYDILFDKARQLEREQQRLEDNKEKMRTEIREELVNELAKLSGQTKLKVAKAVENAGLATPRKAKK